VSLLESAQSSLDRKGTRAGRAPRWASLLYNALLAGGVVAVLERYGRLPMLRAQISFYSSLAAAALILLVAGFALVIAHECGHVVAANQIGLEVVLVTAGPVGLARRDGRLRVIRVRHARGLAGATVAVPRDGMPTTGQLLWYLAGGPVASALVGIALFGASVTAHRTSPLLAAIIYDIGIISLIVAVVNAAPYHPRATTDGVRALMVCRQDVRAERWRAFMALGGQSFRGTRPRDFDPILLAAMTAPTDGTGEELQACLTAYRAALDRADIDAARAWIDRADGAARTFSARARSTIQLERAFIAARFDRDAAVARTHFNAVVADRFVPVLPRLRAEAALLMAEGHLVASRVRARAALVLNHGLFGRVDEAERDWVTALLDDAACPSTEAPGTTLTSQD
jgi:hypothetical protein